MSYEPLPRVPDPAYAAPTAMLSVNPDQAAMQASMQPLLNQNVAYGFNQPRDSEVLIKVRYRTAYREFRTANNVSLAQLSGELSTHMNINQARASLGTAYLLWLLFGWMGAHRWYLGKHNALSWFLWFITGQFFVRLPLASISPTADLPFARSSTSCALICASSRAHRSHQGIGYLWDACTLWRTVRDYNTRATRSAGHSDFLGFSGALGLV